MTADGSDRSFGAPRFDVVLRGYDRRQVDEHIARLQRVLSRMRSDLESARTRPAPLPPKLGPPPPPGTRPRPSPRPRPEGRSDGEGNDVVGTFTERMNAILQAAEEEANEIRGKARSTVRAEEERAASLRAAAQTEEETVRTALADLVRQRDAVLADLTRMRGQLEGLLSVPTTAITLPTEVTDPSAEPGADSGAGQPLPGTPATPEADIPEAEPAPADAESADRPPPRSVPRPAGSTVRWPPGAGPTPTPAWRGRDEAPMDLFRPASEDRDRGEPAVHEARADVPDDRATVGSPAEQTVVVRAVQPRAAHPADQRAGHDGAQTDLARDASPDATGQARPVSGSAEVAAVSGDPITDDGDAESTQVQSASAARTG
jgi:hypothetical protein